MKIVEIQPKILGLHLGKFQVTFQGLRGLPFIFRDLATLVLQSAN